MKSKEIKKAVREGYAKVAKQSSSCCSSECSCCGSAVNAESISKRIGYTEEELISVPEGANLGLGCGNPTSLASLKEGETVVDLGSGPGFDCFLAAQKVGKKGKVIGIDMTPEMIKKAKENAKKGNYQNVDFRLGEIENLPVDDISVDIIMSNCVINLSPDKDKVFKEAFRVLKPGGRIMVSDIVLLKELPELVKESVEAHIGCLAGAMLKPDYINTIESVGFQKVKIMDETTFPIEFMLNDPNVQTIIKNLNLSKEEIKTLSDSAASIKVSGIKPN
ncbi:MAG: arsenite methyltransferase [Elusimicrobia bacterium]|nr:arsenite methyltransferase [Elusimicrobiota bacterium]